MTDFRLKLTFSQTVSQGTFSPSARPFCLQREMAMTSKTPIPIRVRRMDYDIPAIPRYWYHGNPWTTHFMNALSTTFPDGERSSFMLSGISRSR